MQQEKGRFPSPVPSGAGTVGTRCQWVQTLGAPTASAKPRPPAEGLAAGAPGQLGRSAAATWEQAAGKGAVRDELGEAPPGAAPFAQELPLLQPSP